MTQHKIMAGVANLYAIHENADMVRVGVLPALMKAIVDGVETGIAAVLAVMDAFVHLRSLMFVNVRHWGPFVCTSEPFPVITSDVFVSRRADFRGVPFDLRCRRSSLMEGRVLHEAGCP
jgi:hypothetical protein